MNINVAVEYLLWILIAASVIAVIARRLHIPYTVALVVGGLALGTFQIPLVDKILRQQPTWITPNVSLVIFLPPLLFEGSLKIQIRHLRENLLPILLLANAGVIAATFIAGMTVHWVLGLPVLVSLVFGAIVSATDPISVLALFKDMGVSKRLTMLVEGESLLNDGTATVVYGILVGAVMTGSLSIGAGIRDFFVEVVGGTAVGLGLGYLASRITAGIDDPEIEITLTTILAYSSYLLANSLHLSGVLATVSAGLMVGNFGVPRGMSPQTRVALWSFWNYASFVMNSMVFLLIGLQVHLIDLLHSWKLVILAAGAVLIGRFLSVYGLTPISNLFTEKISLRWQHIMAWGGIRGALSLALALSLDLNFPERTRVLAATFGTVALSLVIHGLTIKSLLRALGINEGQEDEYRTSRARLAAVLSARAELNRLFDREMISKPTHETFRKELDLRAAEAEKVIEEIYTHDGNFAADEVRLAKRRLIAAEKSSIEKSLSDGLITARAASKLLQDRDRQLDELDLPDQKG